MTFYLIIRGPLGAGKTTVSRSLAHALVAEHIRIDEVLDTFENEWEEGFISQASFFRANEIVAQTAREHLRAGKRVIFDGNFYHVSQIEDLLRRLDFDHQVFTLRAPLDLCIHRDGGRDVSYGREAVEDVFRKATEFDYGTVIDASMTLKDTVGRVMSELRVA